MTLKDRFEYLKDKFMFLETRQKIIYTVAFVAVLGFIITLIAFVVKSNTSKEVVKPNEPNNVIVGDPIEENKPNEDSNAVDPSVEEIDYTVSRILGGTVEEYSDIGTRILITLAVSKENTTERAKIMARVSTDFLDGNTKVAMLPSELQIGDKVVIYVDGDYTKGSVNAQVILLGDNRDYSYGVLRNIVAYNDGRYIWNLDNIEDSLYVNPDVCKIIDAYTGQDLVSMNILTPKATLLYKYEPEFDITENGNIYHCNEIIVLRY